MKKIKYKLHYSEIQKSLVSHGSGIKRVFINNEDTNTALTQFAWSRFESNQFCEKHTHPTMDEYFFVKKGFGTYEIGEETLSIKEGDFLFIPANTPHRLLVNSTNNFLELIYFGIDTSR